MKSNGIYYINFILLLIVLTNDCRSLAGIACNVLFTSQNFQLSAYSKRADIHDLDTLVKVENLAWSEEQRASRETIRKRLENPNITIILYSSDNEPVGSIVAVPIDKYDFSKPKNWKFYSDLSQSQNSSANPKFLYIVSITAVPEAPKGTGKILFSKMLEVARYRGLVGLLSGVRVSNYEEYQKRTRENIERYMELLKQGTIRDPAFGAAIQSGAIPLASIPDYFDDPPSMNYGLLMFHPSNK